MFQRKRPRTTPRFLRFRYAFALLSLISAGGGNAAPLELVIADDKGQPIADAVAFADSTLAATAPVSITAIASVDQINRTFVPRVSVIRQGQSVLFPNSDNIRHHVYSFSKPNVFELELYEGVPRRPVNFSRSGVVVLGCNIHDSMIGYVVVAPGDVFGKSDANGRVTLQPATRPTALNFWHEALSPDKTQITRLDLPAPDASGITHITLALMQAKTESRSALDKLRALRRGN